MSNCQQCGFKRFWKTNHYETIIRGTEKIRVRMWRCRMCGHVQAENPPFVRQKPSILYFDIETALTQVDIFSLFIPNKYISWRNIRKKSYVVSWAAAWYGKKEIMSAAVTPKEAKTGSDKRILQSLWQLMDSADYVVGHNSKQFDTKYVNYRFLKNGITSPLEYKNFDTLTEARKHFKNDANALEYWSLDLGGDPKDEMVLEDWKAVSRGDKKAIQKMEVYNRGDVRNGMVVFDRFVTWLGTSGKRLFQ